MTRLILSTSNIVTAGPSIIRKPGADRANLELTNSLRANFSAAVQDYSPPLSTTNGNSWSGENGHRTPRRPQLSAWTARDGSDYYVPRIDWSASGLAEEPSQYDVTVKLFYLPGADVRERATYTRDAVDLVRKELGIQSIDLLILSFPGMSFDGDCEWEADRKNSAQGDDEAEIASWPVVEELHQQGVVKKLGISEFGSEKLARFLARVKVRPQVDQINVKDCCNVPPPLIKLAKAEQIELLTHYDSLDILCSSALRELLGQGPTGAGVLDFTNGASGDLTPQWVVKYTAVVRDRGVIENKGYFAAAELKE